MVTLLSNGRPGIRSSLSVEARCPVADPIGSSIKDRAAATQLQAELANHDVLDFIASDESLDRYDEVICASGWRLEAYRRNPVFQNAHQYGDIVFTLGKALITEVRTIPHPRLADSLSAPGGEGRGEVASPVTALFQRIQFATDVNPVARIAYGLYRGKFLNAVSVGFIPLRWQDAGSAGVSPAALSLSSSGSSAEAALAKARGEGRGEEAPYSSLRPLRHTLGAGVSPATLPLAHPMGEGRVEGDPSLRTPPSAFRTLHPRRKYLEQELLEVSAVGIPANPNALALAVKSGAVEKSDLRDALELLQGLCGARLNHATRRREASLLSLARELRRILRRA